MPTTWAIADLHLSFARPDPRERFAARWRDHAERVAREWRQVVGRDDLVLLPGDLSAARNHREVQPDLDWLARLPGTKVLSAGNHDAWFNTVAKVRPILRRGILAVGGDAIETHGVIVCGAKSGGVDDESCLKSLDSAIAAALTLKPDDRPIYALWHHPPFDAHRRPGPAATRFAAAGVSAVVYGHLHIEGQWGTAVQGLVDGVRYHCVAADAVGFRPLRVDGLPTGPVGARMER